MTAAVAPVVAAESVANRAKASKEGESVGDSNEAGPAITSTRNPQFDAPKSATVSQRKSRVVSGVQESAEPTVKRASGSDDSRNRVVSLVEDLKPERSNSLATAYDADPIPVAASSRLLRKIADTDVANEPRFAAEATTEAMTEPENAPQSKTESKRKVKSEIAIASSTSTESKPEGGLPSESDEDVAVPPVALNGYCPLELIQNGRWVQGDLRFTVVHQGMIFRLSGADQRKQFLADPDRYMPARSGIDVVLSADENRTVPGETTYCAIYEGRLYMFSSAATQAQFNQAPLRYAVK